MEILSSQKFIPVDLMSDLPYENFVSTRKFLMRYHFAYTLKSKTMLRSAHMRPAETRTAFLLRNKSCRNPNRPESSQNELDRVYEVMKSLWLVLGRQHGTDFENARPPCTNKIYSTNLLIDLGNSHRMMATTTVAVLVPLQTSSITQKYQPWMKTVKFLI
jgi:hypothetical protein